MRIYRIATGLAIVGGGLFIVSSSAPAKSLSEYSGAPIAAASGSPQFHLSTYWGVIQNGKVDASFNCDGTFGCNMSIWSGDSQPTFSFATPASSKVDYLYGGAFWIGGIVGNSTRVTTTSDGWEDISETQPTDWRRGTMTKIRSSFGSSLRGEFVDTGLFFWDHPHFPLGIKGILRAYWSDSILAWEKTVIYDLTVINIEGRNIQNGYLGLYMDPDIYLRTGELDMSDVGDDLCGSFRSDGIVYAIDGGRRTIDGQFVDSLSPTGAFGVKLIGMWPPMPDTNFNWWFSSSYAQCDYGPRQRGTVDDPYRDFKTGGTGTPSGDLNKYYVLSHKEWDFDTYRIGTIGDSDAVWMEPTQGPVVLECRRDIRFLLSVGPFDLPPDSSVRIVFAMLAGDAVHSDPLNYRDNMLMNYRPDSFYAKLDFSDLLQSGTIADSLTPMVLDPLQPVTGLREELKRGDTVTISWDPWVFDTVTGYDIYLNPIPPDSLPYPGVAAPWLRPTNLNCVATNVPGHKTLFDTLTPHTIYAVSVANRTANAVGPACDPIFVQRGSRLPAPKPDKPLLFPRENDSVVISWQPPAGVEVDHYCIYKFNTEAEAGPAYHAYYDSVHLATGPNPVDTFHINGHQYYYFAMTPFGEVDSGVTRFVEPKCDDSAAYRIVAVDRYGFETEFSPPIMTYALQTPSRDIIVLTRGLGVHGIDILSIGDSIVSFYNTLLQGYDFKIYDLLQPDSVNGGGQTDIHTYAPFRFMILDADLTDQFVRSMDGDSTPMVVTQYLLAGGRVAYFGQFRPVATYRKLGTYPMPSDFVTNTFGLDSITTYELASYYLTGINGLDTLTGFRSAQSVAGVDFPSIEYDTSRYVFKSTCAALWPDSLGPQTASFVPNEHGEVTHLFRSQYPGSSMQEGKPVGVHTEVLGTETWAFGFHLWYMRYDQARQLIDAIMQRIPTGIDEDGTGSVPRKTSLSQNYPNPFNPNTTIQYSVPSRSHVLLEIFNILGQQVRVLVDETKASGNYRAVWDGRDNRGQSVSTGIYLYRLRVGDAVLTKKMLLLK